MTLERQKPSIDKDKGNQTQRRLAIAQNLGRHGASVMVSSRKVSVNLLIMINLMIRIINQLVIGNSFAGGQCWEGCGAAEVRGAGRRWNGENALILWSLSDRGWNKIKNDHHLSQPSLNSYFDLRSAMLGSRRTEALCWNPQSKGGHFDGKHSCSRYWILLNIICNSNHFQGGEVWTFWSPMQRSILTLDPHLDVLRRWENKHCETFMKIISFSSRLGTRYLRSMWKHPSFSSRWLNTTIFTTTILLLLFDRLVLLLAADISPSPSSTSPSPSPPSFSSSSSSPTPRPVFLSLNPVEAVLPSLFPPSVDSRSLPSPTCFTTSASTALF